MATSPLGFTAREQASYTITLDPLRNALISLAMLSADPQDIDVEDWVHKTAAAGAYMDQLLMDWAYMAMLLPMALGCMPTAIRVPA